MTTFFLIRHAPHAAVAHTLTGRTPGVMLGEAGRQKAEGLAERLAAVPLAVLLSSPQPRTRQTAAAIAQRQRLTVEVAEELDEVDFGGWAGRPFGELEAEEGWRAWNFFRSGTLPPGGEGMLAVQARFVGLMMALHAQHPAAPVALVSHADPIRATLAHCLGMPLDLLLRLEVSPASVSVVEWGPWGPKVLRVNDTGALRYATPE